MRGVRPGRDSEVPITYGDSSGRTASVQEWTRGVVHTACHVSVVLGRDSAFIHRS